MGDPIGHFWHDMVESIVIWEGEDAKAGGPPINAVPEADHLGDSPVHQSDPPADSMPHDHPVELADPDSHLVAHHPADEVAAPDHSGDAGGHEGSDGAAG